MCVTRAPNTITNCNVTPSQLTSWMEPLSVEKAVPLQSSAQLIAVEVFNSSAVRHPVLEVVSTTATTIQQLEIEDSIFTKGVANFENNAKAFKLFASNPPAARNIVMDANETLTYHDISSVNATSTPLAGVPVAYQGSICKNNVNMLPVGAGEWRIRRV